MSETITGEGPWRVYLHGGRVVLVEIVNGDKVMSFGERLFTSRCPRCGGPVRTATPDNVEMTLCDPCNEAVARE